MTKAQRKRKATIRKKELEAAKWKGYKEASDSCEAQANKELQRLYDSFQKRIEELKTTKSICDMAGDKEAGIKLAFTIAIVEKSVEDLFTPGYPFNIKKKTDPKNFEWSTGFATSGMCFTLAH